MGDGHRLYHVRILRILPRAAKAATDGHQELSASVLIMAACRGQRTGRPAMPLIAEGNAVLSYSLAFSAFLLNLGGHADIRKTISDFGYLGDSSCSSVSPEELESLTGRCRVSAGSLIPIMITARSLRMEVGKARVLLRRLGGWFVASGGLKERVLVDTIGALGSAE